MPTATRAVPRSRAALPELTVDYPQPEDVILSSAYTMRMGARPGVSAVEVSIDDGPWVTCRAAVGYWWFDWSGYAAGPHEVRVRGRRADGKELASGPRKFDVAR